VELQIDPADVGAVGVLDPETCAEVATRAAARIDLDALDRGGPEEAVNLWRTDGSEAWLNTWWQPRDSGFHEQDAGSPDEASPPSVEPTRVLGER
jgi:hypothetical protein